MRNAYFAAVMTVVLVVTSGGPAAAQELDETASRQTEAAPPAAERGAFDVTPGMARMLNQPVPPRGTNPRVPAGARSLAQRSRTGGTASKKVVAGVAMGFAGFLAGIGFGETLKPGAGGLGAMIGAPLGAVFGVWLAGT
jgi:hypothetical protein